MSPMDLVGAVVLLAGVTIAGCELALFWATRVAEAEQRAEVDDRPSSLPDPYVTGSERDPFAVDLARFRR